MVRVLVLAGFGTEVGLHSLGGRVTALVVVMVTIDSRNCRVCSFSASSASLVKRDDRRHSSEGLFVGSLSSREERVRS